MALSPSRGGAIDETAPRSESDDKYTGEEREARQGVALCLSGGGYRAVLFHLGALRRLNELGVLSKVDTISTVSGGSILSAFVLERLDPWPQKGEVVSNWDARVAAPVRAFTRRNIRTLWFLRRMLPWNLPDSTVAVRTLERRYRRSISKRSLSGIPPRPRFVFCATDMAFGANWEIEDLPKKEGGPVDLGRCAEITAYLRKEIERIIAASERYRP